MAIAIVMLSSRKSGPAGSTGFFLLSDSADSSTDRPEAFHGRPEDGSRTESSGSTAGLCESRSTTSGCCATTSARRSETDRIRPDNFSGRSPIENEWSSLHEACIPRQLAARSKRKYSASIPRNFRKREPDFIYTLLKPLVGRA